MKEMKNERKKTEPSTAATAGGSQSENASPRL